MGKITGEGGVDVDQGTPVGEVSLFCALCTMDSRIKREFCSSENGITLIGHDLK